MTAPATSDIIALYRTVAGLPGATFAEFKTALGVPNVDILKVKQKDTTRFDDNTSSDDPELITDGPIAAGSYALEIFLVFLTGSTAPDSRWRMHAANNLDDNISPGGGWRFQSSVVEFPRKLADVFVDNTGACNTANPMVWTIKAYFTLTAPDTISVQWAQQNSNAEELTLRKGSWMRISKP